jgi:hypothetical protein
MASIPSAPALASTGRRLLLRGAAAAPVAALVLPAAASATDYTSAAEVFDTIDRLEAEVDARLAAIALNLAGAQSLARSINADHVAHRAARRDLRRRLKLPAAGAATSPAPPAERSLPALRDVQQRLVHAHAEGLPALGNAGAVDRLARHMVDGARHLTVIDLWLEAEEARG